MNLRYVNERRTHVPAFAPNSTTILIGGTVLLLVLVIQFLQGKRIIKFKGALHRKVHMMGAWALLAFALFHAAGAAYYLLG